jgi:hypothetical protein
MPNLIKIAEIFPSVKIFHHLLDINKIIMNASSFDKGCLVDYNHFIQLLSQFVSQKFRENFGKRASEANEPVICDVSPLTKDGQS